MPPQQVIIFIIGTIVILFGAYYVTYYISMKASGQTRAGMRNRNITIRDRYSIARDKTFCVVEIAGKVYIVGITNHTMTLLDTIDAAHFAKKTQENQSAAQTPWGQTPVGQYGNKLTRKVVAFVATLLGKGPVDDVESSGRDFSDDLNEAKRKADDISSVSNDAEDD